MADRLTQLQDTINLVSIKNHSKPMKKILKPDFLQQADNFCNSIGILQQYAPPSRFSGSQTPQQNQQEDYAQLFSTLISRCAKDIDTLIESLPNEDSGPELQVQSLKRLEVENQDAAERLEEVVKRGEALLEKIQSALSDIAQAQLDMQH